MMVTVHMFIFFGDSFLVLSSDMIATISMASMDASMYGHKPMMKMEQFFISPEIACKSMDCASTFTLLYASISIP